ncbi:MAG: hypothetical protein NVS4B12_23410 [Ktedonobacteraceae bacterium]
MHTLISKQKKWTSKKEGWHESNIATFLVVIAKEASYYKASVPDVPGCVAVGETRQEAVQNVREALQTYVDMINNDHTSFLEPGANWQPCVAEHWINDVESLLLFVS